MDDIEKHYKPLVTQKYLGATYESRTMNYLKISRPSDKVKKIIWMDCGIHAREWIAPAFCQWFVKEIVKNYPQDATIKMLLQAVDVYVLPVYNIDGYVYSWTTNRMWRKSRSLYNNGTCHGTDLNRNFDAMWCSADYSTKCKSENFCGPSPASEPETQALVNFVKSRKSDILCYLTIHSFSQVILTPYGYTGKPSRNHNESKEIALKAAAALKQKHGTDYKVGSFYSTLYPASGTSQDWVYDQGVEFSFTLELRDEGTYGFQLPEEQIKPTCEETLAAVMTIMKCVADKNFPIPITKGKAGKATSRKVTHART
ncbi:carboxypeptidase O isoform X2 [Ambystoma mexicanum]